MYIAQTFKVLHEWWRYLIGLVMIFFAWQLIGAIPLVIGIIFMAFGKGETPESTAVRVLW